MDVHYALEAAGLAGNEAKVYLALLDLGSALAGDITKRSGVNRTNVYDALDKLIEKGLVSYVITANRKCFEAAPPERLLAYLDEREKEVQRTKTIVQGVLSELEERRKLSNEAQEATIYKGKKGLMSVAEDVLATGQELCAFGATGKFSAVFTHYFKQWHMRRETLKLPVRIIYHEMVRAAKAREHFAYMQMRFTSGNVTPATTWIYGDKVAITTWAEQPLATVIRSSAVVASYREFFELLWKNAK